MITSTGGMLCPRMLTMRQTDTYGSQSRAFLSKAHQELDQDSAQSSEKGWGAAAETVKAIADERGWDHRTHRALYAVVDALARETGDAELGTLFRAASDLHINFYENWYPRAFVESGIRDVERFVEKAERLLGENP